MKRTIVAVLLLMAFAPAQAEWVRVSQIRDSVYYIDQATIRKNGHLRRVWVLQDLRKRHQDGELSRRLLMEYDCKGERMRNLSISEHLAPMASGQAMSTDSTPEPWVSIPRNTPAEVIFKIICAK